MSIFANSSIYRKIVSRLTPSFVLIVCAIAALICANVPAVKDIYHGFWNQTVSFSVGSFDYFSHGGHSMTLSEVINDFLMAVFFLSVGLEIKKEIRSGELSTKEKAMLPVIGACGGMAVPVLLFWLICPGDPVMQRGVAIPMATDIAFSLGVLAIFKTRVPLGLKIFLAALAIADDLGGIIVIAIFYSSGLNLLYLGLTALVIIIMVIANHCKVHLTSFYLFNGLILWYLMLNSGIHATIAGVILAFCSPPHFEEGLDNVFGSLGQMVDYLIVPFFAFANAGIDLSGVTFSSIFSGISLAVIIGLMVGKFVGVFAFSWLAVRLKIVALPKGATWKSFASVCMICGIGFTVSMFIADLSYMNAGEIGLSYLSEAKLGVLVGSVLSALIGMFLLNKTLPADHK